jgi:hypothetical protein
MFSRWILTNIRSRNLALPQDSHSLRGSTRDLWTVVVLRVWNRLGFPGYNSITNHHHHHHHHHHHMVLQPNSGPGLPFWGFRNNNPFTRFEAFTATKINKILPGFQPRQVVKSR